MDWNLHSISLFLGEFEFRSDPTQPEKLKYNLSKVTIRVTYQ